MALMDLSTSETAEVEILHPKTNVPLGITITLYGKDSETFKRIQRKQLNRRLEQTQKARNKQLSMTAEELELEQLDVLVSCTKSWCTGSRPEIELNEGEWLPCTPDNVRKIYTALPWIKEQADQEIGDRSNFLKE